MRLEMTSDVETACCLNDLSKRKAGSTEYACDGPVVLRRIHLYRIYGDIVEPLFSANVTGAEAPETAKLTLEGNQVHR